MRPWVLLALLSVPSAVAGRVKLVIRGETFRVNSRQGGRETGLAGYADQKRATRSQVEYLIEPLVRDMGYSGVDVVLMVHETNHSSLNKDFRNWYEPNLSPLKYDWVSEHGDREKTFGDFDAVFHIRADMILKPLFGCALRLANRSNILFAFRSWKVGESVSYQGGLVDRV